MWKFSEKRRGPDARSAKKPAGSIDCRASPPRPGRPPRKELEEMGILSLRKAVGYRAGGLFIGRPVLGLFSARPCPEPRVPLGRGWSPGDLRPGRTPLFFRRALERPRPDLEGAALRPRGAGGKPR